MKRLNDLLKECRQTVKEFFPWDLQNLPDQQNALLLDVREPEEYAFLHIRGSVNVPRGILEQACEYGFSETVPELVQARDRSIIVICRSGNRSLLAAKTLQELGYSQVYSLNTGIRGWNDYDLKLYNANGETVDADDAADMLESHVSAEQLGPVEPAMSRT